MRTARAFIGPLGEELNIFDVSSSCVKACCALSEPSSCGASFPGSRGTKVLDKLLQ